ncbi:MAG: cation:proton antiporter, partial [Thermoleophilia bacterium]|nr:cation:proton antiporter [Thermoleophilia bacterium]
GATGGSSGDTSFIIGLGEAVGKLALLVAGIVFIERVVMRRMFQHLAAARELLAVASFTVSLGAIGACYALDLSPVLGGFVAGIVMADAAYASQVRSEIAPIRMGLVAVFFAYVGMLADASWMAQHALLIIAVVVPLLLGKAGLIWIAARTARVPGAAAVLTAAALCQLGEFSFAVLAAGDTNGLVSNYTFRLLVSVSLVTLLVTPWVLGGTSRVLQSTRLRAGEGVDFDDEPVEHAIGDHAIVVGVGPAGRAVAAALAGASVPIVVVELNARADAGEEDDDLPIGTRVVFGDAGRPEILGRAGVATARIIVVAIPDPVAIRTVIAQARQLAPDVPIVARGRYNRYVPELVAAGADDVVDEEQVTGRQLAEVALKRLVLEGAVERRHQERRAGDDNTLSTDQVDVRAADPE